MSTSVMECFLIVWILDLSCFKFGLGRVAAYVFYFHCVIEMVLAVFNSF